MICKILNTQQAFSYEDVKSIRIATTTGEIDVMSGHAEFFALTKKGNVKITKKDGSKEVVEVQDGFCRVDHKSDTFTLLF